MKHFNCSGTFSGPCENAEPKNRKNRMTVKVGFMVKTGCCQADDFRRFKSGLW